MISEDTMTKKIRRANKIIHTIYEWADRNNHTRLATNTTEALTLLKTVIDDLEFYDKNESNECPYCGARR